MAGAAGGACARTRESKGCQLRDGQRRAAAERGVRSGCAVVKRDAMAGDGTPEDAVMVQTAVKPCAEYWAKRAEEMDTLIQRSGLTSEQVSAMLLSLELDGQVASLPGGLYQRL